MIQVKNLTKKYGKNLANNNISLSVESGQLAILLGPNGAGKSTLIKSICGLLRFSGSITIDGQESHTQDAKRLLGYVPEFPSLYPMLTVREHLEFVAKAYGLSDWESYANELFERFELDDKQNKLGKELSKGMQQKVSICSAILPRPKVVILDEPLVGLDPHGIRELKTLISDLKKSGCTLMVSTHLIDSVDEDWDMTFIMRAGEVVKGCRRDEVDDAKNLESIYFGIMDKGDMA
jgi:ABC-type multidrug transport system ATPase subunit